MLLLKHNFCRLRILPMLGRVRTARTAQWTRALLSEDWNPRRRRRRLYPTQDNTRHSGYPASRANPQSSRPENQRTIRTFPYFRARTSACSVLVTNIWSSRLVAEGKIFVLRTRAFTYASGRGSRPWRDAFFVHNTSHVICALFFAYSKDPSCGGLQSLYHCGKLYSIRQATRCRDHARDA